MNVSGLWCGPRGEVYGFQADLSTVTDFTNPPGQTSVYYQPQILIPLLDGAPDYGILPAACGDSGISAQQRLDAYTSVAGGGFTPFTVANIRGTDVSPLNPVEQM